MKNMIASYWEQMGLQLRLQILLQGTLIFVLVAAQQWIMLQFEHEIMGTARERAEAVADGVVNGLNILMIIKNGKDEIISDKKSRSLFIQKMAASEGVREVRVIRGKGIDAEFDPGLPEERPRDDMDQRVLASGKSESLLQISGDQATLRTVIPYIAKKNFRSIDCLSCHGVDEGTVVGAASIVTDVKKDLASLQNINRWIWLGQGLLQLLLFFSIRSIVRRLLKQLGGEPKHVIEVIRQIARGNLSDQIVTRPGDQDSLLASTRDMQADLRSVVVEIQSSVEAAVKGDFSRQADLAGKQGFGLDIGRSLNALNANLLAQIGGLPADAVQVATRIAEGELGNAVPLLAGDSISILAAMARMQNNLSGVINEVRDMVNAAAEGDFGHKLDPRDKQGYARTLSELLNRLSDVTETGLQDVIRVSTAIAGGDLTQTVSADYPGLFGQLTLAINSTVSRLQDMIRLIHEATQAINIATHEISVGNLDLSRRTEEQAGNLEETLSSVEQLNSTVRQNAEHAREATTLAQSSLKVVTKGGDIVRQVVTTMGHIQSSSQKIADITGLIDSIAFQTNILALNAAVEAARAGEHGRGFAVVASEVRNLAQRSATAAREIKALIADSVGEVEDGVKLAREAGSTMNEVVHSFQKVASLVTDISNASKEQSTGIEQVTRAIGQMDEVTQQNAALVEQAAAATESLEDQVGGLVKALAMFKLSHAPAASLATPAPAQRRAATTALAKPAGRAPAPRSALPAPRKASQTEEWEEF